ncbi:MAG TPA: hypothetical protein DCG90_05470 [Sphingobium sp.]|jgi:hypothetical protein|uniref:hypothetical protein n=1 Tax=unclassified Sphingobium TaxID=2611147 RepID=UPI0007F49B2C|nr:MULTISPECIES: hypothetical protein [unclassified Sphingobium]OAN51999.1 hypothetical protein A7Q26_09980 [Sphingobium sp. TCM1]WIW88283.1 hypothetical protein K3M67_15210 [Sphingobium sp. V4]HAF41204.1 hypothetical protein [Sphingobium sp.]
MQDPYLYITLAATSLAGLAIIAFAGLRGWNGWLELKRAELVRYGHGDESAPPSAAARIEVADLKERIRKLEAIAAGVDL